jgi:hypothetical protein
VAVKVGLLLRAGQDDMRLEELRVEVVEKGAETHGRARKADVVLDEEDATN